MNGWRERVNRPGGILGAGLWIIFIALTVTLAIKNNAPAAAICGIVVGIGLARGGVLN